MQRANVEHFAWALIRGFEPDVIILDFDMPALDGDRLARLVRSTFGADIPIIFHSGKDPSQVVAQTQCITNAVFVQKPCSPERLYSAICSVAWRRAPHPAEK